MNQLKEQWKKIIAQAIKSVAIKNNVTGEDWAQRLILEKPPKAELGDVAFPMFPYARDFKKSPPQIGLMVLEELPQDLPGRAVAAGPYINVFLDRSVIAKSTLSSILENSQTFLHPENLQGRNIMVEFSSPNTNKPLHLGHLRNNALGESCARILKACGAEVRKVNLINDRGIHICKSMLAYKEKGQGETPESSGIKGDHLVGQYYVKYNQWSKEDENVEKQAQQMLRDWEAGDPEVVKLWKQMNQWTLDGLKETYENTNISFDQYYFESQVYMLGKEYIQKGLDQGVFYKAEDGSIRIDMEEIGLDSKVLLRSDGTSVYITQDIGTAISRHSDWPFDQLIYVVGNEQEYHFNVLFHILGKLGFEWTKHLHHLSYGMVNLPEGKMKSREGTIVDADELLVQLTSMALEEIRSKGREGELDNPQATAHDIALGALHYFLLQVSPKKDMVFNPKECLSFNGNTGPYLQYTTSRISSMLRKAQKQGINWTDNVDYSLLKEEQEWELLRVMGEFPAILAQAGDSINPSIVATHIYLLAKTFSRFYHDLQVLNGSDNELVKARTALSQAVLLMMKQGFELINIPFLDKM
ncbi:MAG: arginine--tRNA ligase [Spirochaetaceae bacterium]|nr:arginine--tRNA ligase [Spirochaetaceae bacterium]